MPVIKQLPTDENGILSFTLHHPDESASTGIVKTMLKHVNNHEDMQTAVANEAYKNIEKCATIAELAAILTTFIRSDFYPNTRMYIDENDPFLRWIWDDWNELYPVEKQWGNLMKPNK